MNRETAGQQAERVEDGDLEHLTRRRPAQALPHVIQVGHDENREDGGLRPDEGDHGDFPARREAPCCGRVKSRLDDRWRECAHESLRVTRSGCPDLPDASSPTTVYDWRRQGWMR